MGGVVGTLALSRRDVLKVSALGAAAVALPLERTVRAKTASKISENSLPIPKGNYDLPVVISDKMFAANGSLMYDDEGHSGLYGDVMLVNGQPWPTTDERILKSTATTCRTRTTT